MKIWATSDMHYFHRNIIKYVNRPFDFEDENCIYDNAKLMVERYNEVVSDEDLVFLVGDLSCGLKKLGKEKEFQDILRSLKGRKILIRGNHDYFENQFYYEAGISDVLNTLKIGNLFFSHYPCYDSERWTTKLEKEHIKELRSSKCDTIICGHVHNKDMNLWTSDGYKRINVCVDFQPNNYYPVDITDLFSFNVN